MDWPTTRKWPRHIVDPNRMRSKVPVAADAYRCVQRVFIVFDTDRRTDHDYKYFKPIGIVVYHRLLIPIKDGGWQDQVGAIWGGFKMTTAKNQLPLEINVTQLDLDPEFVHDINRRLILVYTGITRLAKDLLINVLRNWYGISKQIYDNVQELVKNGFRCARALQDGI